VEAYEASIGRKAIGCKWVYKLKHKVNGEIDHYKACVVAKGFSQIEGIDCDETFAPIARYYSNLMLLGILIMLDLEIHKLDVKITVLHGKLNLRMSTWYSRRV